MKNKVTYKNSECLDLIADGGMAVKGAADGRLVPLIILDTTRDQSLLNLVNIHRDSPPGDVESRWAVKRFSSKDVFLVLKFEKPVELRVVIKFDVKDNSNLIDGIIHARSVYIQPGNPGDKLSHNPSAPKILVEIPNKTSFPKWDDMLFKNVRNILKKEGVGRKELKKATKEYIETRRDVWGRRMR